MIFDLDYPGAPFAAEDAGLPAPTYTIINSVNGHAHLIYALSTPVCRSKNANHKPLNFFTDISKAIGERLHADPSYHGFLCKNPWHDAWEVWYIEKEYPLEELAEFMGEKNLPSKTEIFTGLGRNCTLFEETREWAYREIKKYWGCSPIRFDDWMIAVRRKVAAQNSLFSTPLSTKETDGIAKSIANWTMERFKEEDFSKIQSKRSLRRWQKIETETEPERSKTIKLYEFGYPISFIAKTLGRDRRTISKWIQTAS